MLLKKFLTAASLAAASRVSLPATFQGYQCCTKTTRDCIITSQTFERSNQVFR